MTVCLHGNAMTISILQYGPGLQIPTAAENHELKESFASQGGDVLHVLIAMLVTSIFFSWFVISAIIHENAYELLITVVLSAVIAIRTLYYVVRGLSKIA